MPGLMLNRVVSKGRRGESFLDSVQYLQPGKNLQHPPISPLSLRERARVRALLL